jgi:hypothetical protein
MHVKEPAEYPNPGKDKASNQVLQHEHESIECAMPYTPPCQKEVQFCLHPGHVCHLRWWLKMLIADQLNILYMYAEMGNDEHTQIQLKFQDSPNPSVFITAPTVDRTGLNLSAANHAEITQKLWVLNE